MRGMTTAVGDSIRSKIDKQKKKTSVKQLAEKKAVGQLINRLADES
jgi:hypothetical protein